MNTHEKNAIIHYVETQLLYFVSTMEDHIDPDAIGYIYEKAYDLLNDLELTFETQVLLNCSPQLNKHPPKSYPC
jgi:hypothetical protein